MDETDGRTKASVWCSTAQHELKNAKLGRARTGVGYCRVFDPELPWKENAPAPVEGDIWFERNEENDDLQVNVGD